MIKKETKLWIILIILILLVIGVISVITTNKDEKPNDNKINNNDTAESISIIDKAKTTSWSLSGLSIYQNEKLISDDELTNDGYILIADNYIKTCITKNECKDFAYSYKEKNNTVSITFVSKEGHHDIIIDNEKLDFYRNINDRKLVYHFKMTEG